MRAMGGMRAPARPVDGRAAGGDRRTRRRIYAANTSGGIARAATICSCRTSACGPGNSAPLRSTSPAGSRPGPGSPHPARRSSSGGISESDAVPARTRRELPRPASGDLDRHRPVRVRGEWWARSLGAPGGHGVRKLRLRVRLVLLLFLVGIAIGSAVFSRMRSDPQRVLSVALIANTLAPSEGIALVRSCPRSPARFRPCATSFFLRQVLQILETAPVLAPMAILFGICFRRTVAATADLAGTGAAVGRVTVGTASDRGRRVLGGSWLIPRLGLRAALFPEPSPRRRRGAGARGIAGTGMAPRGLDRRRRGSGRALLCPLAERPLDHGAGFFAGIYGSRGDPRRDAGLRAALLPRTGSRRSSRSIDRTTSSTTDPNGKTDASTAPGDIATSSCWASPDVAAPERPPNVFDPRLGTEHGARWRGTRSDDRYRRHRVLVRDAVPIVRRREPQHPGGPACGDRRGGATRCSPGERPMTSSSRTRRNVGAGVGNLFTSEFYGLARSRLVRAE